LGRKELREERTHEVRNNDLISVIEREKNVDRRFGPREFVDSGIEEKGSKKLAKVSEAQSRKGSWPMVVVYGHIKGEA
jgi:hypothetical protein